MATGERSCVNKNSSDRKRLPPGHGGKPHKSTFNCNIL